jgi:hypothetical protein
LSFGGRWWEEGDVLPQRRKVIYVGKLVFNEAKLLLKTVAFRWVCLFLNGTLRLLKLSYDLALFYELDLLVS